MLLWTVICDLYLFHFTVLLNPDFNCSKSFLSFSFDKVTTGTYNFACVIWNSNPVWETIADGSLLFPAALTLISVKAQFLDHVKINSISQLTLMRLGFLRVVFPGGGQFDLLHHPPSSYFKKNLSNINITLYNY